MKMSRGKAGAGAGMAKVRRLAVGYARISKPNEKGISIDAQKDAIMSFADTAGYQIIEVFEEQASGVGHKSFFKRERLQAALDLAARNNAYLIVWDWDRLSRHASFEKQILKVLPDRNRIICAKEGTNMSRAAEDARFTYAEKRAKEISNATKEGMARKSAEGATFGNPDISRLQPRATEAYSKAKTDLVRRIADLLRDQDNQQNMTYAQIADLLNQKGVQTLQNQEFTASRARTPVKDARALLLREEEDRMKSRPKFGMF